MIFYLFTSYPLIDLLLYLSFSIHMHMLIEKFSRKKQRYVAEKVHASASKSACIMRTVTYYHISL